MDDSDRDAPLKFSLVSVVIPVYNSGEVIVDTVNSVFSQTYKHFEIIVVDDGSTDESSTYIKQFGNRLKYIYQQNRGVGAARNRGLEEATGDYLAILDHDDIWHPDFLAEQVKLAQRHPTSGLIACDGEEVSEEIIINPHLLVGYAKRLLKESDDEELTAWLYDDLVRANFITTFSQTIIPRKVMERIEPLLADREMANDYDCFLRIAHTYPLTLHKRKLLTKRYVTTCRSGPLELRQMIWGLMGDLVIKFHLSLYPDKRRVLLQSLKDRVRRHTHSAWLYGRKQDRRYAMNLLGKYLLMRPNLRTLLYMAYFLLPRQMVVWMHDVKNSLGVK